MSWMPWNVFKNLSALSIIVSCSINFVVAAVCFRDTPTFWMGKFEVSESCTVGLHFEMYRAHTSVALQLLFISQLHWQMKQRRRMTATRLTLVSLEGMELLAKQTILAEGTTFSQNSTTKRDKESKVQRYAKVCKGVQRCAKVCKVHVLLQAVGGKSSHIAARCAV